MNGWRVGWEFFFQKGRRPRSLFHFFGERVKEKVRTSPHSNLNSSDSMLLLRRAFAYFWAR